MELSGTASATIDIMTADPHAFRFPLVKSKSLEEIPADLSTMTPATLRVFATAPVGNGNLKQAPKTSAPVKAAQQPKLPAKPTEVSYWPMQCVVAVRWQTGVPWHMLYTCSTYDIGQQAGLMIGRVPVSRLYPPSIQSGRATQRSTMCDWKGLPTVIRFVCG